MFCFEDFLLETLFGRMFLCSISIPCYFLVSSGVLPTPRALAPKPTPTDRQQGPKGGDAHRDDVHPGAQHGAAGKCEAVGQWAVRGRPAPPPCTDKRTPDEREARSAKRYDVLAVHRPVQSVTVRAGRVEMSRLQQLLLFGLCLLVM